MVRMAAIYLSAVLCILPFGGASFAKSPADVEKGIIKTINECRSAIEARPRYQPVLKKLPPIFRVEGPSIKTLRNNSRPSAAEIDVLIPLHDEIQFCQGRILEGFAGLGSEFVALFSQNYWEWTQAYLLLLEGKYTWGEFAKTSEEMRQRYNAQYIELTQAFNNRLYASQAQQAQMRQAALTNLMNWVNTQQLVSGISNQTYRPRITTCQFVGRLLQCNSM